MLDDGCMQYAVGAFDEIASHQRQCDVVGCIGADAACWLAFARSLRRTILAERFHSIIMSAVILFCCWSVLVFVDIFTISLGVSC